MLWNCPLIPDEKEIGEVRVRDLIIIGWVSKPNVRRITRQRRMLSCSYFGLTNRLNAPQRLDASGKVLDACSESSACIRDNYTFSKVPTRLESSLRQNISRALRFRLPRAEGICQICKFPQGQREGPGYPFSCL